MKLGACCGSARGNVSVNLDPSPSLLRTRRSPPMPRARSRLIARPSPVPSVDRVRLRWSWTNGSKIASCFSRGMPIPVSGDAEMDRRGGRSARDTVATASSPPGRVNLIAFEMRLMSTCLSRSRSAMTTASRADVRGPLQPFRPDGDLAHTHGVRHDCVERHFSRWYSTRPASIFAKFRMSLISDSRCRSLR